MEAYYGGMDVYSRDSVFVIQGGAWRAEAARLLSLLAEASEFMASRGWWLLPQLTGRQYIHLLDHKERLSAESLTAALVSFANKPGKGHLRGVVQAWNVPAFQTRAHILDECLWAHEQEKFSVAVATSLVQVEGIVRQSLHVDLGGPGQRFEKVRGRFATSFHRIERLPKGTPMRVDDLRAIENFYNLKALESLFKPFHPGKHALPATLNRHAIAHGLSSGFGTLENSTKCLLLLDMLHALCKQLEGAAKS
jgi:hypothetical protein